MNLGVGRTGSATAVVVAPASRDPMNADPSHVILVTYEWDDAQAWDDTHVWKD